MKNKVIQQAWNNKFTHNNFYNFTIIRQNTYQTRLTSKTMVRYYRQTVKQQ